MLVSFDHAIQESFLGCFATKGAVSMPGGATAGRSTLPSVQAMKFAYEDLSETQFEGLIVLLCQQLLGISVQGFAKGPDGGRDAKFVGIANLHPSKASPWSGITIIQAKHTNGYNRSFSETDFFNPNSSNTVIGKEIPRIKKLRNSGELDHYMLFANRRLSGNAESKIRKHISDSCNIPIGSIYLCGIEQLEIWMKTFPNVPKLANLDPVDAPLIVRPDDLAEVVEAFAAHGSNLSDLLDDPPSARVPYEEKNKKNNMRDGYAKELRRRYLKETAHIRAFLYAPENAHLLRLYEAAADEFHFKILAKRKDYQTFDEVFEYLLGFLFSRDPVLRMHRRLTKALLFYMYWNCDVGESVDAAAD